MPHKNHRVCDSSPSPTCEKNPENRPLTGHYHGPDKESSTEVPTCRGREDYNSLSSRGRQAIAFGPFWKDESVSNCKAV
jgi:hypothetical protein